MMSKYTSSREFIPLPGGRSPWQSVNGIIFMFLLVLCLLPVCGLVANAADEAGGGLAGRGSTVMLTRSGDAVVMDNGIIRAEITPRNAQVISLRYQGYEMVSTGRRKVYFSMAGEEDYEQPRHCEYSLVRQDPDVVDVSCRQVYQPDKDKHAFDIDVHFVLRAGVSGLYAYAILDHPAAYPVARVCDWRTVWFVPDSLEKIYADDDRHWVAPDYTGAQVMSIKEIYRITAGPWAGKYDCKYGYAVDYQRLGTYGHASDHQQLGAWMVLGGYDYFNDGPLKQDLGAAYGYNLVHLHRNHYGARVIEVRQGESWRKIFGPWLMYCNSGKPADGLWEDAKAQVAREKAQWPYQWLHNAEYAASGRGSVGGRFIIHDPLHPEVSGANAWVGVALPEETAGNWQMQGRSYQYWTRADADGRFAIPAVRPGNYTLYAFTTGVVGEFSQTNVAVTAGATTTVGDMVWNVTHRGSRLAWEIGVPDRTSAEFRHGGTDYWKPYLWNDFDKEFSNPIEYDVAVNRPGDLNYAHSGYGMGEGRQPWKWRIHFSLDEKPKGVATLTLAFAGANGADVNVFVNDRSRPVARAVPPVKGGNALLRESNHAKYGVVYVPIPAGVLRKGANTVTLVAEPIRWDGDHVMYDYLSLELP